MLKKTTIPPSTAVTSSVAAPKSATRRISAALGLANARVVPAAMLGLLLMAGAPARAQDMLPVLSPGDAVVTGFSGATEAESLNKKFIDLDGPSLRVLQLGAAAANVNLMDAPAKFELKAGQFGQLFGIALDDGSSNPQGAPSIYVGASVAFGVQIVTPDVDGDGLPERTKIGAPEARFMDGQFGQIEGAGPGTIYKVDGVTGEVTVFANISVDGVDNTGPGIGNIAYDKANQQFFVTDLDTGMIHRVSSNGTAVELFDHGVAGRTAQGLPELPDDGAKMNITDPSFNSEDPETWGLTPRERRVWGVAVNNGRLYYAVSDGPQIWSVGINEDGSFANDARKEIDVETATSHPVTDMVFDKSGRLYLVQRGGLKSSYDYTVFAKTNESKTLRYTRDPENPSEWIFEPEEYAIGMRPDHMNAAGGIDLGHAVIEGRVSLQSCNFVWTTGDVLTGIDLNGLQGNRVSLVRPANVPPINAVFVDYNDRPDTEAQQGHVGDVEIFRSCAEIIQVGWPPAHLKVRSHWKWGSQGHSKRRSHWKCVSRSHYKRRSHYKWGSRDHYKRRSHAKWGSRDHSKRRSHYKSASRGHLKVRSHWKYGSQTHLKRRSHWKCHSNVHTKSRSHHKYGSHNKHRSHNKFGSHSKRRSHHKFGSHSKRRSHHKFGSHSKRRSHHKFGSHSKRRSHHKYGSRRHDRLMSTLKNRTPGTHRPRHVPRLRRGTQLRAHTLIRRRASRPNMQSRFNRLR